MTTEPSATERHMQEFVTAFEAEATDREHMNLSVWLARRSHGAIKDVEGVTFNRKAFAGEHPLDIEVTFLDINDALESTRVHEPTRFATFLVAASHHHPDEAFCSAAQQVMRAHLYRIEYAIVLDGTADPGIGVAIGLRALADASAEYDGHVRAAGERCHELSGWIFEKTAPAHLIAEQHHVFDGPTDVPYGLHNLHLDCSAAAISERWHGAMAAVHACPTSPAGTALRGELITRLRGLLEMARFDLGVDLQEHPDRYRVVGDRPLTNPRLLTDAYAAVQAELDALADGPGFTRSD